MTRDDLNRPNQILQLGTKPNRIDILTSIEGVGFNQAWDKQVIASIDGIAVPIIGIEELIENKNSTGRAKDLGEVENLQNHKP